MQLQVGLTYNSQNGLRVNDIAENVGQGWDLVAGGMIVRTQAGEPDDQMDNDGDGTISDVNKYPAGYLYNTGDASQGCPNQLGYYPIFGSANQVYKAHNDIIADEEQDYFTAQFNGRAVMFVLRKNSDSGISVGTSRLRIWFQTDAAGMSSQHIRTTITSFSIQDEFGSIYNFSQLGLTKVLRQHPSLPNPASGVLPQPSYADGGIYCQSYFDEIPISYNPWVATAWYLTSITDALTQRSITFNYTVRNFNNYVGDNISSIYAGGNQASGSIPAKTYVVITRNISMTQTPFISTIQFPDSHQITFNYDMNNPRVDLAGDYPMKSVVVSYIGRVVSDYQLNTTYFILNALGIPSTPDQQAAARLCLRSVMKIGVDEKENQPPYVFDYYLGAPGSSDNFVPPLFYYTKDIGGYYNGNMASTLINSGSAIPILTTQLTQSTDMTYALFFNLNFTQLKALCFLGYNPSPSGFVYNYNTINPGYAQNGLLKTITFPSGGTLTYEYQQNAYNKMLSTSSSTTSSSSSSNFNNSSYVGGVHVSQTSQTDGGFSNSATNPIVTTYNYVDNSEIASSLWGFEDPINYINTGYTFALDGSHKEILGGCNYDFQFPGITDQDQAYNMNDNINSLQTFSRVTKGVTTTATLTIDVVNLFGEDANPPLLLFDVLTDIEQYLVTNCDNGAQSGFSVSYTNANLKSVNSYPAQFSRVEVIPGGNSHGIGKTVYEYTDFNDYPLWDNVAPFTGYFPNPSSRKQRAAPWAYGLLKQVTVYDSSGNLIKQTINQFDFSNAQLTTNTGTSCNCNANPVQSLRSDNWSALSVASSLTYSVGNYETTGDLGTGMEVFADPYQVYTGRVPLTDAYERTYQQGDPSRYLETHTNMQYSPNNYLPTKITAFQSNGDQKVKESYYSCDYTVPGVLQTLNANNMIYEQVASYNSILKSGATSPGYTSATVAEFSVISTGDIQPTEVFTGRSSQPITGFSFDPTSLLNYPNLIPSQYYEYNSSGDLQRIQDEGGRVVTNLYDYNHKFLVASITNVDPDIDQSAYTSFETTNNSNWVVNGTPSYGTTGVTGGSSFNLTGGTGTSNSVSTNIVFNKPYILSFWAYQSTRVNLTAGAALTKSGPTINGFTYNEYAVPAGSGGLTISGSGTIDELRLYPAGARMQTTTYDPLLGKTSDCDMNNRILYYVYDNMARLRFIKDENGNIVKMYEYNTVQPGSVGTATIVPFSGTVYAQLSYQNINYDAAGDAFADIVASFFADAACTQPVYVNITLNINEETNCDNGGLTSGQHFSMAVSGSNVVLISQSMITQVTIGQDEAGNTFQTTCNTDFTLLPGAYTIE